MPNSDFQLPLHNNPAVFMTWLDEEIFPPPSSKKKKKRYHILLLDVLLATVARESWVQLQAH